ncbi:YbhB/YbcL family Raf kinase inhibitor-like protein [Bacterioplanoides pacificum]|uniref:YbhB/YbcL family Raf kinase inhibitor-like protein n=1 Tax=Bacterioplanoides pacificum TaxID=1171596 RepID=A0ABV7VSN4_9GAMM
MKLVSAVVMTGLLSPLASADMVISSDDIRAAELMPKAQEFSGFGCDGGNQSPHLSWSGAPEGTQAYAVFAYDPDAPTGSGWWHWQLVNLPATTTTLAAGAGAADNTALPPGSMQMRNDYGAHAFGGACPPAGDKAHRYQFTVFALKQKLELPADASAALTGYMVNANALDSVTLEALYQRD